MSGVLEQERQRQRHWADLGLPDPIRVQAEERATRRLLDRDDWRSPKRALLAAYLAAHPEHRPNDW